MVKLRLRRVGLRNQPSYRIVAADKEKSRDGRFLEIVGFYNPRTNPSTIELNEEKVYAWLSQGAKPSDSVAKIFQQVGLMDRFEKFKTGTSAETLAEEAKKAAAERIVSPKTKFAPKVKEGKKVKETAKAKETSKVKEPAEQEETPQAEAPQAEAPQAEAAPEVEASNEVEASEAEEAPKEE